MWYSHKQGEGWCNESKIQPDVPQVDEEAPEAKKPTKVSPQDFREASIEAQTVFKGFIELMKGPDPIIKRTEPLGIDIINWGCQKLGIDIGKQYEVPREEIKQALAPLQSQIEGKPVKTDSPKGDLEVINETLKKIKWSERTAITWLVKEGFTPMTKTLAEALDNMNAEQTRRFMAFIQSKVT